MSVHKDWLRTKEKFMVDCGQVSKSQQKQIYVTESCAFKKKKIKIPSQSSADSVIITFTNMAVNIDDFQIKMCMMTLTYFQGHQS